MIKKVVVIDLWTDDNRGDAALQISLAKLLRERFPGAELVGVYRFGWNEMDQVGREIALSSKEFDRVLGGPRLTKIGGGDPGFSLPGQHVAFQLYSIARFLWAASLFRWLGPAAARLMTRDEFAALSASRDADVIVWKGKNFREYDSNTTFVRSVTLSLSIMPAMMFHKHILCVNASFWDIRNPLAAFVYRQVMSRCEYVTVREPDSLEHLRKLVPNHRGVTHAPDLSFKLLGDLHQRYLHEPKPLASREACIALTITDWGSDAQKDNYVRALAAVLERAASLGIRKVLVVPQVIRVREDNASLLGRILALAPTSLAVEVIEREMTIDELVATYATCKLLVGTRMHSCVFARAAGTPFVAIAYDEGSKWAILGEFWPKRFVHEYSTVSATGLRDDVSYLLANAQATLDESEPRFAELCAHVRENIPSSFGADP